jgi:hypothetical protein
MRLALLLLLAGGATARAQDGPWGRWDLTVQDGAGYPMWLELLPQAPAAGRLQGRVGHALPLTGIVVVGNRVRFPMPSAPPRTDGPRFEATATGARLRGEIICPDGRRLAVAGVRAPALVRDRPPVWGEPVDLLAGGLDGWRTRDERNGWRLEGGELVNTLPSSDLITRATFTDFRLELEVNVPPGGNSGIYLRGRHEVQVQDDFGRPPDSRRMGGIYGQVTPLALPARPAGVWQQFTITLVGRRVTVVLNGITILDQAEIPGITGGALDSREGAPGPIMLQGDHSGVRYRNIRITPARSP